MIELQAWYDQAPEDDAHPGDPAISIRTAAEVDALIEHVQFETRDHRVPAIVQLNILGTEQYPVISAGLGQTTGFIHHFDHDAGRTRGDGDPEASVEYTYCGSLSEVPADSVVSIDVVRRGLHEFLATGTRPSALHDGV